MVKLTLKFNPKDARLVRRGLENLRAELPRIARSRMFELLTKVVRRMQKYPPAPAGSTYIRTMRLQKAWKIRRAGLTGYSVSNRASFRGRAYTKYVHGSSGGEEQARVHVGRWPLLRVHMEDALLKAPKAVADNVHLFMRRAWGRTVT